MEKVDKQKQKQKSKTLAKKKKWQKIGEFNGSRVFMSKVIPPYNENEEKFQPHPIIAKELPYSKRRLQDRTFEFSTFNEKTFSMKFQGFFV